MARSNTSIYSALLANVLIAVFKFIAGSISNSTAMIAEGVHSVVDTVNEILLLYGIRQSKKPPDSMRPFGYGRELYFWSFMVSMLIFGLGGGVSIYQGVQHLRHPEPLGDPFWSYMVLLFSMVSEGISFLIALKQFNKLRGNTPWWTAIRRSKDPPSFLVMFEDGAAVMGLVIVLVLVWFGHHFGNPYLDGVASVLVGLLLIIVSLIAARESRSLLMGEGIAPETQKRITAVAEKDPAVVKLLHLISMYQAPETVVLMMVIAFKEDLDTADINDAIDRIRDAIQKEFPLIRFVLIQPDLYEQKAKV